jgi:hypothetical protein
MPIEQKHDTRLLTDEERSDLTRRALAAWFSSADPATHGAHKKPTTARMATKTKTGEDGTTHYLHFAVVHAGADVLAVYRAQPRGDSYSLRLLIRPPRDLVRLKG